jgi:hypothetical protein
MIAWSKHIDVRQHFQRSVRIDTSQSSKDALSDFVLHETGKKVLYRFFDQISNSKQRAFTWTGPYGTGKSSLAQFLLEFLSRKDASRVSLKTSGRAVACRHFTNALNGKTGPWLVIRIAGERRDAASLIGENLLAAIIEYSPKCRVSRFKRIKGTWENGDVFELLEVAKQEAHKKKAGLLLAIDEMGKLLEHAVENNGDLHIFQEIAERFGESSATAVFLGILHQAFQEYAGRIERRKRAEWSKIQGRFEDVPFSLSIEESVALIGQAIGQKKGVSLPIKIVDKVVEGLGADRFQDSAELTGFLRNCLPLHPITALVLAFSSRQKFGQNERSVFSFLASKEPGGFRSFLDNTESGAENLYSIDLLFDYLQTNLQQSILASPIAQQWSEANEALERIRQGNALHVKIVKAIALLDLFGRQFGVRAKRELLEEAFPEASPKKVQRAIKDLVEWSVILFRQHIEAFVITEGSDLDVDREVESARGQLADDISNILSYVPEHEPVIAKRHYHQKGTLRWFSIRLMPISELRSKQITLDAGKSDGIFVVVISDEGGVDANEVEGFSAAIRETNNRPIIFGLSPHTANLMDTATEVAALERLINHLPELQSDKVARREVFARLSGARDGVAKLIRSALTEVSWFYEGEIVGTEKQRFLSEIASAVADRAYKHAPIIRNEILNRHNPSTAANKGTRVLMHAMTADPEKDRFGIEKYPAEVGIYMSVLRASGLHRKDEKTGVYEFHAPTKKNDPREYLHFWNEAKKFVEETIKIKKPKSLDDLYTIWAKPPYGLRSGVMPLMAMTFILSRSDEIAVYVDGQFEPALDDFVADRIFKTPSDIALRLVPMKGVRKEVIDRLAHFAETQMGAEGVESALDAARQFAQFAHRLQPWVKRTKQLSPTTREIRNVLLNAKDPYALLTEDLPKACGLETGIESDSELSKYIKTLETAHSELRDAYDQQIENYRKYSLEVFGFPSEGEDSEKKLQKMAISISGHSTDPNFTAANIRLESLTKDPNTFESLAALLTLKPVYDWQDEDILKARIATKDFAEKFLEIYKFIKGRRGVQENSLSLQLAGPALGKDAFKLSLNVPKKDEAALKKISEKLKTELQTFDVGPDIQLASIAAVLRDLLQNRSPYVENKMPKDVS